MITTSTPELEFTNPQATAKSENQGFSPFNEPSLRAMTNILNFSKNLEVQKSDQLGIFTMIRS